MVSKAKAIDDVVSEVGNMTETDGLVKNDAAMKLEHLLGKKAAMMLGSEIAELKNNPQQYSTVFKDKGLRVKALTAIAEKARATDFPTDELTVYDEFENFMGYCTTFAICPTIGMFATWLGVSFDEFESRIKHYRSARPEVATALDVCKEIVRGFIETKVLDGDVAPAVYLHQNKAYFGATETAPQRVERNKDEHVRDVSQINEIIDLLPKE